MHECTWQLEEGEFSCTTANEEQVTLTTFFLTLAHVCLS